MRQLSQNEKLARSRNFLQGSLDGLSAQLRLLRLISIRPGDKISYQTKLNAEKDLAYQHSDEIKALLRQIAVKIDELWQTLKRIEAEKTNA